MALLLQVHRLGTSSLALCLPNQPQTPVIGLGCDWERIAWNRLLYDAPADSAYTNHAMMMPYGQLAQGLGLISKLLAVPVPQKAYCHQPAKKILLPLDLFRVSRAPP